MTQHGNPELTDKRHRLGEYIFNFLASHENQLSTQELKAFFATRGILPDDPRLPGMLGKLYNLPEEQPFSLQEFCEQVGSDITLLERIFAGDLIIPDFDEFCRGIEEMFNQLFAYTGGHVADYIPQLAKIDPEQLALSICTIDGQCFNLGDYHTTYSVQSSCKPVNYCLVLEELGEKKVHQYIGREASGHGFNELKLNKENLPHNPMINAGAIMACSLIRRDLALAERFEYILSQWQTLCGNHRPSFNNAIYLSEKASADRNFALAYFMNEKKKFPPNTNLLEVLDFYFQCCSVETSTQPHAILAATLAGGGSCPFTEQKILKDSTVKNCLSLMSSCGLYDYSGEFSFTVGLPAKSAVSGCIMLVVPNVLGMVIWSPRLDELGNSVRGIEFCKRLVDRYNFHIYDSLIQQSAKYDPRCRKRENKLSQIAAFCWAAYYGDLGEIKRLSTYSINLPNETNYDGRTALHLAAAEGHVGIVRYLLQKGANINARDRWNHTPLFEAKENKHTAIIALLTKNGAEE